MLDHCKGGSGGSSWELSMEVLQPRRPFEDLRIPTLAYLGGRATSALELLA